MLPATDDPLSQPPKTAPLAKPGGEITETIHAIGAYPTLYRDLDIMKTEPPTEQEKREAGERLEKIKKAISEGNVQFSGTAQDSIAATGKANMDRFDKGEYTPEEVAYNSAVAGAVLKPLGHTQAEPDEEYAEYETRRLYTVTTLAVNAMYGGRRTVAICTEFERSQQIVERNEGDIWEGSYNLVLIESLFAGWLYGGLDRERYWYKWIKPVAADSGEEVDDWDGQYAAIETPPGYENTGGFGAG